MPSTTDVDRPEAVLAVVERYGRLERPISSFVAVLVGVGFLVTFLATSLLPGVVVGGLVVVLARAPVLRSSGSVQLRTDANPESVVDDFTGPTPPMLAFQWGVADELVTNGDGATYRFSYALGLKSAEMTVAARTEEHADGQHRVTLDVTTAGRPWATYDVSIRRDGDRTRVDVEFESNRRFGLRRLPQRFVVAGYRDDALAAQGYAVVDRDSYFGP